MPCTDLGEGCAGNSPGVPPRLGVSAVRVVRVYVLDQPREVRGCNCKMFASAACHGGRYGFHGDVDHPDADV